MPTFGEDTTGVIFSPEISDNITPEQYDNERDRLDDVKEQWERYDSSDNRRYVEIDDPVVRRSNDNYVKTISDNIDKTKKALKTLQEDGDDLAMVDYINAKQETLNSINAFIAFHTNYPQYYGEAGAEMGNYTNIAYDYMEGTSRNTNGL